MPNRRAIRGVLQNWLGTYTSRYSDYDGYWLFGFLVDDLREPMILDLLEPPPDLIDSPREAARAIAVRTFAGQLRAAGFSPNAITEARVEIRRAAGEAETHAAGHVRAGARLVLVAMARVGDGALEKRETLIVAAPHDPRIEGRSARPARNATRA